MPRKKKFPIPGSSVNPPIPRPHAGSAEQTGQVFISHTGADDAFVKQLREALETHHIPVWVDSRNLRGGSKLVPEIALAIQDALSVIVVLSRETVNSRWVRREIEQALSVEKRRQAEGYRVIPLLLPGLAPAAVENWFDEETVAVPIQLSPGGLDETMPHILAALGERLPTDPKAVAQPEAKPIEELVLILADPKVETHEGKRRVAATATLAYEPANLSARRIESRRFHYTAPLGPIEIDDLRWYLEQYFLWPLGVFKTRAEGIEQMLPQWGCDLFAAALGADVEGAREALSAWQHAAATAERRFSVQVDSDLPAGSPAEDKIATREAATELLALPWELLHDAHGWLFQGRQPVGVRRRLPNRREQDARPTALPVRILLISPRPEHDGKGQSVGFIDHRISARPLVEAVEALGELVRLTVLTPPTYAALDQALQAATNRNESFDVVHFDGHGVYDRRLGLGGLCFEDPKDIDRPDKRAMEFVDAVKLAGLFRQHRIVLVFLEACQTAVAEVDPTSSVAARLLEEGVTSVVAMSHNVLVETARRFVHAFYKSLAEGARVGRAMLAGQRALYSDTLRGKIMGAGDLRLQDWFVPVLYQEKQDPQLITKIPAKEVQQLAKKKLRLSLGAVPDEPTHKFQGRSHELLALERLLYRQPWAVVRGTGGVGKTTLAAELARWLTHIGRFERVAFVSLEQFPDIFRLLIMLGQQLLPEGVKFYFSPTENSENAIQKIERALADHATIIILDNCESVLPQRASNKESDETLSAILSLCERLLDADPDTRLVFTTRESLPAPFDHRGRELILGALDRTDAIELVSEVMKQNGWTPPANDPGSTPQEVTDLVEAANCHARALVALAREIAKSGVKAATANFSALMANLERKHPGERENSLYASVELSLRRLPPESRERIKAVAVCQGSVHLAVLGMLSGYELDDARRLADELIEVGLGQGMAYGHLQLDPALPPYLRSEMQPEELDALHSRWAEAMALLTKCLYQQRYEDVEIAARLTLLELPNFLAMLERLRDRWRPELVVDLAAKLEMLLQELSRPKALAQVTHVREQAALKLGGWSHARFTTEESNINLLLRRGELPAAYAASEQLLQRCFAAGEFAYPGTTYDLAMAYYLFGLVLSRQGAAEAALAPLAEAQRRFCSMEDEISAGSKIMVFVTIAETGRCLSDLSRLDEAASAYKECIKRAEKVNYTRGVAVAKAELGIVSRKQERYTEALEIFDEARDSFTALREPRQVAWAWKQIGNVHSFTDQFELAENAYRQSLAIEVREDYLADQANTLGYLGNLYGKIGRFEESATFHQQAVDIDVRLKNQRFEGEHRSNLAQTLLHLGRYAEARQEVHRAIECEMPFGHVPQPWLAWAILEHIEWAVGHAEAALAARQNAIEAYLAYRRTGGVSQSTRASWFERITRAIKENKVAEAEQELDQLRKPADPPFIRALLTQLQFILAGDRNSALATDPDLDCRDAVELQFLLEHLSSL